MPNKGNNRLYIGVLAVAAFLGWITLEASAQATVTFIVRVLMIMALIIFAIKLLRAIYKTIGLTKAAKEGF